MKRRNAVFCRTDHHKMKATASRLQQEPTKYCIYAFSFFKYRFELCSHFLYLKSLLLSAFYRNRSFQLLRQLRAFPFFL